MSTRGGSNDATLPLISTEPATTLNGAASGTAEVVQRASIAERTAANTFVDVSVTAPLHVVQTGASALPTGASTEASLSAQSAKLPATLGQKAMSASMAVVVASDQTVSVGSRSVVTSVLPTLDTAAYASGDSLHTTVMSFLNAVPAGGTGYVESLIVIDSDLQSAAGELWLFSQTVTPAAANAAHSISDFSAGVCVGVIPFGPYYASALNSVSVAKGVGLPVVCNSTTLFGIAVTRGTPTHTASGLTFRLQISQN